MVDKDDEGDVVGISRKWVRVRFIDCCPAKVRVRAEAGERWRFSLRSRFDFSLFFVEVCGL